MDMDIVDFVEFYIKAKEQEAREQIQRQWTTLLPYMDKESFISFEEYYDKCTGRNIDTRPTEEILREIEEIEKKFDRKGD